eukprot:c7640_g1_i1 orf=60-515(+)
MRHSGNCWRGRLFLPCELERAKEELEEGVDHLSKPRNRLKCLALLWGKHSRDPWPWSDSGNCKATSTYPPPFLLSPRRKLLAMVRSVSLKMPMLWQSLLWPYLRHVQSKRIYTEAADYTLTLPRVGCSNIMFSLAVLWSACMQNVAYLRKH